MMMRIFGAALIVSGGYTIGWIRVRRMRQRFTILSEIYSTVSDYLSDLKKERRSLSESFRGDDPVAEILLGGKKHPGLTGEDHEMIGEFVGRLRRASYQQSVAIVEDFLQRLEKTTNKLQEDTASQGKAFPLLTGAIGFLIAVLLY